MQKRNRELKILNENGMALVLTLMAVSFLVAITVQLATSVNWQMQGAGNLRDSVQLDAINRSGLNLVRAALVADLEENEFDSEHDSWGKLEASNLFGAGKLEMKVTDLTGLLQVNALVPEKTKNKQEFTKRRESQKTIWNNLLKSGKFAIEDDEVEKLIDAVIDWIDTNDDEEDHGAESGYYLALSPSYSARNAPITSIEELLLIRGMTKELFYGNEEYSPLVDYLTVAGRDGKINVNSAPKELLMALDQSISAEAADDLIEFREEEDNKDALANPNWMNRVVGGLELDPDSIDVKSQYFKISVTAKHNTMTREGKGIIQRIGEKGEQNLLYWEVR